MATPGAGSKRRLRPGTLITVASPFTDLSGVKRRPALVLIVGTEDLVVCGVTSKLSGDLSAVALDREDMSRGRLPRKSEIRPLKHFTMHRSLIRTVVGEVHPATLTRVHDILVTALRQGREG